METKIILQKITKDGIHYSLRLVGNQYIIYRLRTKDSFGKGLTEAEFNEKIKEFKNKAESLRFFEKITINI